MVVLCVVLYCLPQTAWTALWIDLDDFLSTARHSLRNLDRPAFALRNAIATLHSAANAVSAVHYTEHFHELCATFRQIKSVMTNTMAAFITTMCLLERTLTVVTDASIARCVIVLMYATVLFSIYRIVDTVVTICRAVRALGALVLFLPRCLLLLATYLTGQQVATIEGRPVTGS